MINSDITTSEEKNILPVIKDYTDLTSCRLIKKSNFKKYNRTLHVNRSTNDILETKYNNWDLFFFPKKKKFKEKINSSYSIYKNNINQLLCSERKDNLNKSNISENKKDINSLEQYLKKKNISIIKKNKKIKIGNRISVYERLIKTKKLSLIKYNLEMKKERLNRIIEEKKDKISLVEDQMKSLINVKDHFTYNLYIKNNECIKLLERNYKKEVLKNNKLIKKIEDIQNDIKNIELTINKVKNEKENIQRWILFQIQVKEKLITIPNYYNIIFEDKNYLTNKKKNLEKNTIEIIEKYKNKIIFENVNDFINEFVKIEDNTLQNIKKYELIRLKIYNLKKEKRNIQKNVSKLNLNDLNLVKEKEETLNNLKNIYIKTINKEIIFGKVKRKKKSSQTLRKNSVIKETLNDNNNEMNKTKIKAKKLSLFNCLSQENLSDKIPIKKKKHSKLYLKIFETFKNSLSYKSNSTKYINHFNLITDEENTNESKMLNMLRFIEEVLNTLLYENNLYKMDLELFKQYKKVFAIVDQEIKQRKFIKQMKILKEKREEDIKSIEKKMKRKYILPHKKINENLIKKIRKEQEKIKLSKKEKSVSYEINDFLYED